jgi:hypothetical protein
MVSCSCSIFAHNADIIIKVNQVQGERGPLCRSQDEIKADGLEFGAVQYGRGNWFRRVRGQQVWHALDLNSYSHQKTYVTGHFLLPDSS